jgi:ATP-binding cassette subfamily F protein 3
MRPFITMVDVHKHYGTNAVLDGVSLTIGDEHRVAVIGRNGAGKSTLCRMILGQEEADAGKVTLHEDLQLSWLEQEAPFQSDETALGFLERWSRREEWACAKLAAQFKLGPELIAKRISELSGGMQTRLRLAGMLLREPNFLILDEPTNYLDLKTLMLLEGFLRSWRGGYLIVSHDREFLKRTCRETLEVGGGGATFYPGGIEEWLAFKDAKRQQAEHHNANVAVRRKELEDFIARNKAKASKASQAASKMKMLDRLETVDIEHAQAEVVITIPKCEERKGAAIRIDGLGIGYPGKRVAEGIELEIERGSRVAVVGDNGQGKSTFLKTIAAQLAPLGGSFTWGHAVRVGAYAQHVYQAIDAKQTVQGHLEKCAAAAPGYTTTQQLLDLAGAFLFRGDDVKKRVGVLSGGERARLCLAGLLLGRHQALLLDEPTNHLDFETVEALAGALAKHDGTVFFTSHDRTFVSVVATHVVDVRDGQVKLYPGDYATYVWRLEQELAEQDAPEPKRVDKPAAKPAQQKGTERTVRRGGPEEREARKRASALERAIAQLEAEQKRLTEALATEPAVDAAQRGIRLGQVTEELAQAEEEWLALQERFEQA